MSSKISFFNKTLFKSDIKRYWWMAASETLLLVIFCVVPLYKRCLNAYINDFEDIVNWTNSTAYLIPMLVSFGTAVIFFTFMHFTGSVSHMHSLPVRRFAIFTTKLISSAAIIITPLIITAIIIGIMSLGEVCREYILPADIGKWLYTGFIYSLIIFSLTVLVNMMTGNPIGTVVFTVGFGMLPLWINTILHYVFSQEIHGYSTENTERILEYLYIGPYGITDTEYGFVYPVMSVLFLAGAYLLYRIRKSESHGEVIAFKWLTPVFIGVIATLASGLGYAYAQEIFREENLLSLLPFGILGTGISYMISKKALDFKGTLKPIGIYVAAALIFMGIIHFDITGFEGRVPAVEDVESVYITSQTRSDEPMFINAEDIEKVTLMHRHFIEERNRELTDMRNMLIVYNLKNGRTLTRSYEADVNYDKEFLKPLMETEEYRRSFYSALGVKNKDFTRIEVNDRRIADELILHPDDKDMQILINALKKDMLSRSYECLIDNPHASTSVYIYWNVNSEDDRVYQNSETITVQASDVNTIKALKKLGYYDSMPDADNISEAYVRINRAKDGETISVNSITEKEEIKLMYEGYPEMLSGNTYTNYEKAIDVYITYTMESGHRFDVSCSYDPDKLPEVLKKYIK